MTASLRAERMENAMRYILKILALLIGLVAVFETVSADSGTIMINDAWIKEAPPGMTVLAGYMTIENRSSKKDALVQVSSPDFGSVEMHLSVIEDEKARMIQQHMIAIEPGGTTSLKPGGYHLMLMDPKRTLRQGDSVDLELVFESGEKISIKVPVITKKDNGDEHQHHH